MSEGKDAATFGYTTYKGKVHFAMETGLLVSVGVGAKMASTFNIAIMTERLVPIVTFHSKITETLLLAKETKYPVPSGRKESMEPCTFDLAIKSGG